MATHRHSRKHRHHDFKMRIYAPGRLEAPLDREGGAHEYHTLLPSLRPAAPGAPIRSGSHEYGNLSPTQPRATAAARPGMSSARRPTKCYLAQAELLRNDGHRSEPAQARGGTLSGSGFYASVVPGTSAGPSAWYGDDEPIWVEIVNGVCRDVPPSQARTRASGLYGGAGYVGVQAETETKTKTKTKTSKRQFLKWLRQRSERTAQPSKPQPTQSG